MISYRLLFANGEVSALAEVFDEALRLGFGDFMSEVSQQKPDECLLRPRTGSGGFPEVFEHPTFPFVHNGKLGFGFCLGLWFGGSREQSWSCRLGRANKGECGEAIVTLGRDVPAQEVFNKRVVTGITRHNVEAARGIGSRSATDVVSKSEIQGVLACRGEAYQLYRDGVLEKSFDQRNIEYFLLRAYQQGEADGFAPDNREINLMDILEINEHVVYWRREIAC